MENSPNIELNESVMAIPEDIPSLNDLYGRHQFGQEHLAPIYRALGQLEGRIHGLESGLSDLKQEVKQSMSSLSSTIEKLTDSFNLLSVKVSASAGKELGQEKARFGFSHVFQLLMNLIAVTAAVVSIALKQ